MTTSKTTYRPRRRRCVAGRAALTQLLVVLAITACCAAVAVGPVTKLFRSATRLQRCGDGLTSMMSTAGQPGALRVPGLSLTGDTSTTTTTTTTTAPAAPTTGADLAGTAQETLAAALAAGHPAGGQAPVGSQYDTTRPGCTPER